MEINNKNPLAGLNGSLNRVDLYPQQKRTKPLRRESISSGFDRIELSVWDREIQRFDSLIQSAPGVRQDKIDAVRSAIEAGTYNVKAEKIADKMIGAGMIDAIF